jgi:hypothetical protein
MMEKFPSKYKDYRVAPSTLINQQFSLVFNEITIKSSFDRLETAHNNSIVITQALNALERGIKVHFLRISKKRSEST